MSYETEKSELIKSTKGYKDFAELLALAKENGDEEWARDVYKNWRKIVIELNRVIDNPSKCYGKRWWQFWKKSSGTVYKGDDK